MTDRRACAVIFDFDGTLIPKSTGALMRLVADRLGPEAMQQVVATRRKYSAMFMSGCLSEPEYAEWLLEELGSYVNFRLHQETWRTAVGHVRLREGVPEFLMELRAEGIAVGIVSAAVGDFVEHVLENSGVRHLVDAVHAARLMHADDGTVSGWEGRTLVTTGNKGEWSRAFADRHGVPHEGLLAVGDSPGDVSIGHLRERRVLIAETDEEAGTLRALGFAQEVLVTSSFVPVAAWLRSRFGLPR